MDWLLLVKIVIVYLMILFVMKFMGKREIGQLSLFDFVVLLIIADFAVMGMESKDIPFYIYLIGIALLGVIQKLLALILLRVPKLRNLFDGKQSLIINDGKINLKEMRKQSYNIDDLITQLRLKNVRSLSEVKYAILESNGEISVFKFSDFKNNSSNNNSQAGTNTNDKTVNVLTSNKSGEAINNSSSNSPQDIYPFPLIVSGKINYENLDILQIEEKWVLNQIKNIGYQSVKEVYYANYENGELFIAKTCNF